MEPTSLGRSALRRFLWLLPVLLHAHAAVNHLSGHGAALRQSGHLGGHTLGVHEDVPPQGFGPPAGITAFPVPEVRHSKEAGNGYLPHSPLYPRQEAKTGIEELVGQKLEATPKAHLSRSAAPPPVSTTMECIINLTGQFFFVYTAWFVVQALNRLKVIEREREERCLVAVVETVFFVPMLCVLFLASRLRALQLTQGETEKYGLPQWWVKGGMIVCTWSVFFQTLLVFACTAAHGELWEAVVRKQGFGQSGRIMMMLRNTIMFCIYAGFTTVCIGTCVMMPPPQVWPKEGGPPVSPAVLCTIVLTVAYFAVYLALACARLTNEVGLMGQTLRFSQAQELLISATATVAFAPMLCVIFMAARIQALQFDFKHGNPEHWVQVCFYLCTGSILLQAALAIWGALTGARDSDDTRDFVRGPPRSNPRLGSYTGMDVARSAAVVVVHVCVVLILLGMSFAAPRGDGFRRKTMPTPLKCVILLTALYFVVHLALWGVRYMQRSRNYPVGVQRNDNLSAIEVFLGVRAKEAVAFCPMFCILFLSTLMRSLQISGNKGAPPDWCQWLTCLATWSIVFLTVARVDVLMPRATRAITTICTATQYVCLLLLYLSAIAIVVALFTMTSETDHAGIPAL